MFYRVLAPHWGSVTQQCFQACYKKQEGVKRELTRKNTIQEHHPRLIFLANLEAKKKAHFSKLHYRENCPTVTFIKLRQL